MRYIIRTSLTGSLSILCFVLFIGDPVEAKPKIASGSQCSSDWVNNEGAMNCFIQGEEESRQGVQHPHYVACVGGDVFCCVDDDGGNQDCVAQAGGRPTTETDKLRAILSAHRAMLMSLGRYYDKPENRHFPEAASSYDRIELRLPGGAVVIIFPGQGGGKDVVYAAVDLVCGNKTYTVSTGNNRGECQTGGNGNNAICDDGRGNKAEVYCSSGCKSSAGSGSCSAK